MHEVVVLGEYMMELWPLVKGHSQLLNSLASLPVTACWSPSFAEATLDVQPTEVRLLVESRVRGDGARAIWPAQWAGYPNLLNFFSAPFQVSTLQTVARYPQLTNYSLPQLIFTLPWLLALLEPGVPGPGNVSQHQGDCQDSSGC